MPSVCVSGAGNPVANGTYTQSGSVWIKDVNTSIEYENDYGDRDYAWMLRYQGSLLYQSASASATPATTGWVTVYGTAPAPTVTAGECAEPTTTTTTTTTTAEPTTTTTTTAAPLVDPYCVSGAGTAIANGTYSFVNSSYNMFMSGYWQHVSEINLKMGYGMMGSYEIYNEYTRLYYASSLTGPWTVEYGTGPAPTVTAGECGTTTTTTTAAPTTTTTTTAAPTTTTTTTTAAPTTTTTTTTTLPPDKIRIKRSSSSSAVPATLLLGEIAANIADQKVWIGNNSQVPVVLSDYQNTFVYQGDWDLAVNYKKNDVVKRNGSFYMTTRSVANNGVDPATDNGTGGWQIFSNTVGNQGFQGSQGLQGLQGNQGAAGTNGSQGNQGYQGVVGTTGSQGLQGRQGATGNNGSQGFQGSTGTGSQGFQGHQGDQGSQGNQGFQGRQGFQGHQGDQGWQGEQGFQGRQGFQGHQGDQGSQGDQGYQGSQGDQGQGDQGSVGSQGNQGFQGVLGTTGNQGYQGFQGNQGYQGLQGVVGTTGNQGNQGYQGVTGTGNQGSQGSQGLQGLTGPVAGSANQIVYKDGSNVAAGSSSFTFDDTTVKVLDGVAVLIKGTSPQPTNIFTIQNIAGTNLLYVDTNYALYLARSLNLTPFNTSAGNTSEIRFYELAANGTNYVGFKAGDNIASNVIWTLPTTDGTSGQVLSTNASGVLSWITPTSKSAGSDIFLANNFGGL